MNSAVGTARRSARKAQRVPREVREPDHLVALIVMPENDDALPERRLRGGNPRVHLVVREAEIALRERLPLPDARLLDVAQEVDIHLVGAAPEPP